MSKKKGLMALVTGTALGVGVGMLFAPRKGCETRKMIKDKMDELWDQVKDIDAEDVKIQIEEKINEIKDDLKELDKEKVMEIAKEKADMIKDKIDELAKLTKKKATPAIEKTVDDLRKAALKATKEVEKKLSK